MRRERNFVLCSAPFQREKEGKGEKRDGQTERRETFAEPEPEEQTEKENNLFFPPAFCFQPVHTVKLTSS